MYHRSLNVPRSSRDGGRNGRKAPSLLDHQSGRGAYSAQSILTAMERFVRSVDNMQHTILIPSRLRDMQLDGRVPPPHPIKADDLHSFYGVLNEVRDELLWGPGSALLGSASSSSQQQSSFRSVTSSASITSQCSSSVSYYSAPVAAHGGIGDYEHYHRHRGRRGTVLRAPSVLGALAKKPSESSLGSAAGSDQDTDSDSLSESMVLTDSDMGKRPGAAQGAGHLVAKSAMDMESLSDMTGSEEGPGGRGDDSGLEHGRHLASAFRHHLQGLHVILQQLADSADYLAARYQEEVDSDGRN